MVCSQTADRQCRYICATHSHLNFYRLWRMWQCYICRHFPWRLLGWNAKTPWEVGLHGAGMDIGLQVSFVITVTLYNFVFHTGTSRYHSILFFYTSKLCFWDSDVTSLSCWSQSSSSQQSGLFSVFTETDITIPRKSVRRAAVGSQRSLSPRSTWPLCRPIAKKTAWFCVAESAVQCVRRCLLYPLTLYGWVIRIRAHFPLK